MDRRRFLSARSVQARSRSRARGWAAALPRRTTSSRSRTSARRSSPAEGLLRAGARTPRSLPDGSATCSDEGGRPRRSMRRHSRSCSPEPATSPPSRRTSPSNGPRARSDPHARSRRPELSVLRALLGAYQTAAASVSEPRLSHSVREPRGERRPADRRARRARAARGRRAVSRRHGSRGRDSARSSGTWGRRDDEKRRVVASRPRRRAFSPRPPRRASTSSQPLTIYAAASLTDVFRALDPRAAVQLRRLEHARDADPQRRARRHLRLGSAAQHPAAVQGRGRREAGHLHVEPARAHRSEVEPGGDPVRLRPAAQAREAGDRRAGGSGRRLHADGAPQDGPARRCCRRSSARRPTCGRSPSKVALGQARRRLRVRHRRACRPRRRDRPFASRPGHSLAFGTRSRLFRRRRERRSRRHGSGRCFRRRGQTALRSYGFLPLPKASS